MGGWSAFYQRRPSLLPSTSRFRSTESTTQRTPLNFTYEDTPVVYSISPKTGLLKEAHPSPYTERGSPYQALSTASLGRRSCRQKCSPLSWRNARRPVLPHSEQMVSVAIARFGSLATVASQVYFSYVDVELPHVASTSPQVDEVETWPPQAAPPCRIYLKGGPKLVMPLVKSVSPTSGSVLGGTNVTLSGQNFTTGPRIACIFGVKNRWQLL